MSHIGRSHPLASQSIFLIIQNNIRLFFYVFFAAIGSYYNWIGIKRIEDDLKIDKAIIESEFLFLKNQFHSHLTFNFLNFCFNKIRLFSQETAAFVEEFSDILRYSLSGPADEAVSLEKEIEYIENCISFQKCLITNLNIHFDYEGNFKNVFILPRLLIVFIENALNFGALNDPHYPIVISIKFLQGKIFFNIQAKKNSQLLIKDSRAELLNIEQILKFYYPDKHILQITNNENLFSCELQLENLIK